jgi:hypothetical protein
LTEFPCNGVEILFGGDWSHAGLAMSDQGKEVGSGLPQLRGAEL